MSLPAGSRSPLLALVLLASSFVAPPARAQHGFVPPEDRVLHERLAEARVVAMASVERVDPGRILLRDAVALRGEIEPEFQLKRAPSRPPPWIEGDRVMVLLAGARSPYRWVEKPVEAIALDGPGAEARWREALLALDAIREDARARRDLYARWCDEGSDDLRAVGLRGLLDLPGMMSTLSADFALDRARVASDPARATSVRRAAVRVATRHPDGIHAMLETVRDGDESLDAEIADVSLQAGLRVRDPESEPALVALLDREDPALREVALRLSAFAPGDAVEQKLSELAVGHPQSAVRDRATAALRKLRNKRKR